MDTNLQKYQAFVRTAELGSFSKAAQELHYSQSGVSRMVADLERDWQVTLLERRHGGVRLTSDGTKLLPLAKSVVAEAGKLQMEVDSINGLQSGLVRIGTFSSVAPSWLPNIIKRFQAAYPAIDYEIVLGDYAQIETWLLEGAIDCGFTRMPAHPDLEASFLEQDKLMAVLPLEHP
ncbi:MAG: LysR family transcriptional regulator, partial [Coriobacteriales bacterium]|nr:LysR family transcriptional regulator [Coriobacteriales bacterium]